MAKSVEFMETEQGRIRAFTVEGFRVSVAPKGKQHEDAAFAFTLRLSTALEDLANARKQIADMQACVPPRAPVRILGPGCIRFSADGRLWLLSKRASGWAAFGVYLDGWDDLFRRYNVRVVRHGTDESGAWWEVENAEARQ